MLMLRWKLFVPLAVVLTLLGMLGSKYWSASASHRQILALEQASTAEIAAEEEAVIISLTANGDLEDLLAELDAVEVEAILADRNLKLQRTETQPVDTILVRQTDLILAQAVATREYYSASLQLQELAEERGYRSALVIWGERVVAEVGNEKTSYIAQQAMGVNP